MKEGNLYDDPRRYDLVMGQFASARMLEFYRRQVSRYGQPVLELACGSGRLTIPLAEQGVEVVGLDISQPMLELAAAKARQRRLEVEFVRGDMRDFSLDRRFQLIIIPAQSLSHLHRREELEACFACVRRHLMERGRLLIELFNPSVKLLSREPDREYAVGGGDLTGLFETGPLRVASRVRYDSATQVNHILYIYRDAEGRQETALSFEMRQFFPQEIEGFLFYNGFVIEQKYGGYDEAGFSDDSLKQLIVCSVRGQGSV